MSKSLTSRLANPKGPFPALIPVGRHAGRPAISLRRPITLVGSRENAHVHLSSQSIDPAHALIVLSGGRVFIRDLASHAGVIVNDEPVLEVELGRDDVVKIGSFQFRMSMPAGMPGAEDEARASGRFMLDGQMVEMDGHVLVIGRRGACDVVVSDPMASRVHAAVVEVNGQYVVRDLGSRAGTLVNGQKVHEQVLESGDEIHVGSHGIFFQGGATRAAAAVDSGADLVDLEDSLLAASSDAAPVAEVAEEDPLDLHLPVEGEEPAEDERPVAEVSAAAEGEDDPIPMDLELDLSVPESSPAAEPVAEAPEVPALEAVETPEVTEAEPVAAAPAAAEEMPAAEEPVEDVTIPVDVAEPAPAEPEAELAPESVVPELPESAGDVEEPTEAAAPPPELSVAEPLDDAVPVERADVVEPPAVATEEEREEIELVAPVPVEAVESEPVAEVADEAPVADVSAPIDVVDLPIVEPVADAELPVAEEAEGPVAAAAEEEPIAPAPEQPVSEPAEDEASVVAVEQQQEEPLAAEPAPEPAAPVEAAPEEIAIAADHADAVVPVDEDDLLRFVNEDIAAAEHAPADSLSGTPFGTALGEVVTTSHEAGGEPIEEPVVPGATVESEGEPADVPATAEPAEGGDDAGSFGFGANQVLYLTGSPVGWHDASSLGPSMAVPQLEVSLSGVYGTVEGVEQLDEPAEAFVGESAAPAAEQVGEIPVETEQGVEAAVAVDPPAVPGARKEQLLGFIRIEEVKPADPLVPKGPIEPVRSKVEPAEAETEPAVELPLETGAADRPGERAAMPAPADSPDSLHAVKPPPAAYRITRGLSSLTGGGRAVDVFSQLPVVSEDPVLGKVSGPAQIPPVADPALAREPVPPPTEEELSRALPPQAEFDAPGAAAHRPGEASPLFIRKLKRLFRERGGTLSVVLATAAAGAATYGLTPSTTIVRAEVNYRNFAHLPVVQQRALEERQHDLLTDPAVLANAVEAVTVGSNAPGPGFLASPVVVSTMLDRADVDLWPVDRPGTLALSLRSSEPAADSARLRALLSAVVDARANKQLVASSRESAEQAKAARAELAELDRNIDQLEHERRAAQARLASADERPEVAPAAAPEPSAEERAWGEASLATLRAQADVADLADRKVPANDPRVRQADSRLAAARAAEAAARGRFVASQHKPGTADDAVVDPQRRAAEVAIALRTLRDRREAKAAEAQRLATNAAAAVYPELPGNGGVWTNPVPDHRNLYSLVAASAVGLSLSTYIGSRSKRFA